MAQFKTCTEYEAAVAGERTQSEAAEKAINDETTAAQRSCESLNDPQARDNCKSAAVAAGSQKLQGQRSGHQQRLDALRKQAKQDGVLFDALIITDPRNATRANTKKTGPFADANVIKVGDVDGFIKELEKDRCTVLLMLVLDGDDGGAIEIEGQVLSRQRLTEAKVKLRVWEILFLEGTTARALWPSYGEKLTSKLGVHILRDNWEVLAQLPQPPKIEVDVDPPDTHKIESSLGARGLDHFVTVRGSGEVRLRATLTPPDDTPENKAAIGWTASAGTHLKKTPGDPLSVSLSRGTWKKVQIWVTFKGTPIKQLVVWIVWVDVTAKTGPSSGPGPPLPSSGPALPSLDGEPLGWQELRADPPNAHPRFEARGNIDWLMKINPPELITDADRPAIEKQVPVRVPVGSAPAPTPFCGWEFASDTRLRTSEIIPPSKKAVLTLDQKYKWPAGGVDGKSEADVHSDPYPPGAVPGWPCRVPAQFEDSLGHKNRQIGGFHQQGRIFVRVQLDATWYRCSKDYLYRFRASAKWTATSAGAATGTWNAEPHTKPVLKLDNAHWAP